MIGWWPGHNFSVVARSLLKGTINLGLPWDFNELHVAKISPFATSALTAGQQPLYCMGRADLCVSGKPLQSRLYNCVLVVSPMPVIQSNPFCGMTSSQFAEACHLPDASPRPGAHCRGTTAVVSLTRSSVPREVDDYSIQVTSFSAPLSLSSLDRLRANRLLLPRSGLERSDLVHWPVSDLRRCRLSRGY
jgi:hypothetical protein